MSAPDDPRPPDPAADPAADAPAALAPPADPALGRALEAFERGDFAGARRLAPDAVPEAGDDPAHLARLRRALAWEPTLWITAAICAAIWIAAFAGAV